MADQKPQPLLEALKIAKGTKAGVPIQIQKMVKQISDSEDAAERKSWAKDVSRWLYTEINKPGVDQFTVLGYSALQNALAPYIPQDDL